MDVGNSKEYNVQLFATDWGFDERYKIIFTINEQEEAWGQLGPEFGERPVIDRPGYRDMAPTETGQWNRGTIQISCWNYVMKMT